ncbi:hypothetical protein LCM20_04030 [Halobacillus litoralis]|uniref:hypothetical protein n=1 Tax=Halobacillus litoralis TaxID=45668 RepID=UPI001CD80ECA|nr:hypothetical protein [Halobacillus litoralis]MCA0969763.1 hypothetical protein [Halobacillus litoralis]
MKYLQPIFLIIMLCLIAACGKPGDQVPEGYYSYNTGEVQAAVDHLSFTPELPDYIPIPMVSVVSDKYEENQHEMMDVSFYTEANDLLSIEITKGDQNNEWIEPQKVSIDHQIDGIYEDNRFAKQLSWTKDGITYTLSFRESVSPDPRDEQSVTKEHLIEVARSFHL